VARKLLLVNGTITAKKTNILLTVIVFLKVLFEVESQDGIRAHKKRETEVSPKNDPL
jgi:hypothetical protein